MEWHRRQEKDETVIYYKGNDLLSAEIKLEINIKEKSIVYIANDREITLSELYDIVGLVNNIN